MSSQKQIDSARANGAKSHGPKTEAGRKKSSRNAVKHGLYSSSVVLSTEPRKQYDEMLDAYLEQFHPEGPVELDLVEEMVAAKWRQRRLRAIETELLEEEMNYVEKRCRERGEEYNEMTLLSRAYERQANSALALLTRHEARLERAYSRALKNLQELQRQRTPQPTAHNPQPKLQERTQSDLSAPQETPLLPTSPKPLENNENPQNEQRLPQPETSNQRTKERNNGSSEAPYAVRV